MTTATFRAAAILMGSAIACSAAFAAPKADSPQARFQQERAACMKGLTNQDRATCLYEARSAYDEARRGVLEMTQEDGSLLEANARKRCEPLPTSERVACLARMDGAGIAQGSAQAGGIYRELTVVEQPRAPRAAEDNTKRTQ